MCKRNCVYRGSWACMDGGGTECTYSAAALRAHSTHTTRTGEIMVRLGKTSVDKEVRTMLKGPYCPLYEWNGKGKPSQTRNPKEYKESRQQYRPNWTDSEAEQMMQAYQEGLSDKQISEKTGIWQNKVSWWRRQQGLQSNYLKKRDHDWDKALTLWKRGESDGSIARAIGASLPAVYNWRARTGLTPNYKRTPVDPAMIAKRVEMYKAGASDCEMARELGVSLYAIRRWRGTHDLPAHDTRFLQRQEREERKRKLEEGS